MVITDTARLYVRKYMNYFVLNLSTTEEVCGIGYQSHWDSQPHPIVIEIGRGKQQTIYLLWFPHLLRYCHFLCNSIHALLVLQSRTSYT